MSVGVGAEQQQVTGVMVHHSAVASNEGEDEAERLQGYQRYHQEQGWPDIAYHVGVGRSGRLYELRDPALVGDTFTEYDPAGWFLVLVDGHFDEQAPPDAQLDGLVEVLAWASARFAVPLDDLASHRDVAATTCPGERLFRRLPDIGAEASRLAASGGVQLEPTCPSDDLADAWRPEET
ncbi:peptidoglycan recognition family protein [Salsipaludibacter albus]|uniref:peptidoglycan recognition protein family protein n=1 Tax=Salsipaludibacter albus TaxID=2849650 RepID=UPI001EE3B852|nr:peptidoglycan recognition family protein [Salsipaludibacter albus]MBY5162143.1 peptidoglycan recognition protein family protein [Salsipaludibacter albus]